MKTGTVKSVAAFGKLVGICNDLGARYDPSKATLTTTALATLLEQAQQNVEAVSMARVTLTLAINNRQEKFAEVYPLAARIVRALAAAESSREHIRDAILIRRKLSAKVTPPVLPAKAGSEPGSAGPIAHKSSRLDYDGKLETFSSLVKLVQKIPSYAPNEPDLKLTALHAFLIELQDALTAVADAANAMVTARISRNKVMIGKGGVIETGNAVKEYIRSVFGVRSEPAKELGKLRLVA